jgi:hypothetical protein
MKGFKDKSSKFRPTENKIGVRKSRDVSTKNQGIKFTKWKVVLEDPRSVSGTNTHIITLGKQADENDVISALSRMQENGHFMYYDKDLQFPYLHSISKFNDESDHF